MADGVSPLRALDSISTEGASDVAARRGPSGNGFWRYDIASESLDWSDCLGQNGVASTVLSPETVGAAIHPDDLQRFRSALAQAAISGEGYTHTFRILAADGAWRVVSINARAEADAAGKITAIAGGVLDITEIAICRTLAEEGNDIITQTDDQGKILYISPSVEAVTGYRPDELLGRKVSEFLSAEVIQAMDDAIDAKAADPAALLQSVQYSVPHKDGRRIWLESRLIPLTDPATGCHLGSTDVARDITQRKAAELELERANCVLNTLMEASPSGIVLVDDQSKITSSNHTFLEMWGLSHEVLQSGDASVVLDQSLSLTRDPDGARQAVSVLNSRHDEPSWHEIEMLDGRWIDRYTVPVRAPDEGYLGRAWFFRDVTEHKRALAEAVRMAKFDALTGLANRSALVEVLERTAGRARTQGEGFALFYLDLDGFKDVNDTLGHGVGDQLLVAVAQTLVTHCPGALSIARLGGDEFAVLVQGLLEVEDAAAFAEAIISQIGALSAIGETPVHTSASLGVELFAADAPEAPALLARADMALYQAKAAGPGSYRFFSEDMLTEARNRVSLAAELREALSEGQLFLAYQPAVSLANGAIVGMEALVRWRHPKRGILGPDVFIPVAEKMGLIRSLGRWVLHEAARQLRVWQDQGLPKIRMGVNVSALQFRDPEALEADIDEALKAADLPPWRLELELTESALMTAAGEGDILGRLHGAGVRIAIDDFGTGYSSLDYLRRLPAHRIKIDQTFVCHLDTSPGDAAIVKATIGLARDLGMSVIAEGVETEAQMRRLAEWGCGECQGYYFDRPLSPEEAAKRLVLGGYDDLRQTKAA